jgi:ABC-type polysaccharide/polyol phosphate transport system ATPase subunit
MIVVSHDPRVIATFCDRALLLDGGRIVLEAKAPEVAERYMSMHGTEA